MTATISGTAAAMWAIFRRDASMYMSYRMQMVTQQIAMLFSLLMFYYIAQLVRVPPFTEQGEYFAFVVVGIVIFGIVRSSLSIPSTVRQELVAGTYERLVLSPFGGTGAVVAMMIFPLLYALFTAAVTLLLAAVVFGVDVQWGTAGLAIPIGVLGAMSFAPFALVFAAITLAFKQAPGQGMIIALVSIVSGMYFPVDLLPNWLQWVSKVQPFTPTVDLMRHVLVGLPLSGTLSVDLIKLVVFAFLLVPVAIMLVSEAGRFSRRRGTVIEY